VFTVADLTTSPRVIKETRPVYLAGAKKERIQGSVEMECVVLSDGTLGDVRVRKPLDPGLDAEAVKTLRQRRFSAGVKDGRPVPVQVMVEMTFSLR
jgi:TonB family protein